MYCCGGVLFSKGCCLGRIGESRSRDDGLCATRWHVCRIVHLDDDHEGDLRGPEFVLQELQWFTCAITIPAKNDLRIQKDCIGNYSQ